MEARVTARGSGLTGESRRCESCGGINPATAEWCGQCLERFVRPEPPAEGLGPPGPVGIEAGSDVPGDAGPDDDRPAPVRSGAFLVAGDRISWTCSLCATDNPLESGLCSVCGATFASTVREPEAEVRAREPNTTAMYSLFYPGAGHAYLGMWGQAVARGVTATWVAAVAVFAALQGAGGGSALIASVFSLAGFGLWLITAHDAYREARRQKASVILKGRRFLYVTIGLLGLLFVMLMIAVVSAKGGAPVTP